MNVAIVVDAIGHACPIPVIKLADAIEIVLPGEVVEVLSDDPASKVDIPVWCRLKKHEYVGQEQRPK
jgi:TusA-related sulfurtransferase